MRGFTIFHLLSEIAYFSFYSDGGSAIYHLIFLSVGFSRVIVMVVFFYYYPIIITSSLFIGGYGQARPSFCLFFEGLGYFI